MSVLFITNRNKKSQQEDTKAEKQGNAIWSPTLYQQNPF